MDDGPPLTALDIAVTGEKYTWHVRYPGPDRQLDTPDDVEDMRNLHVPADVDITLHLNSRDLIYSFAVPAVGVRKMAVPDVPFTARFKATATGRFPLLGDQLCGYTHPSLLGTLIVLPPDRFLAWQRGERDPEP